MDPPRETCHHQPDLFYEIKLNSLLSAYDEELHVLDILDMSLYRFYARNGMRFCACTVACVAVAVAVAVDLCSYVCAPFVACLCSQMFKCVFERHAMKFSMRARVRACACVYTSECVRVCNCVFLPA